MRSLGHNLSKRREWKILNKENIEKVKQEILKLDVINASKRLKAGNDEVGSLERNSLWTIN